MLSAEGQGPDELEQGHCSGGGTVTEAELQSAENWEGSWEGERCVSSESLDLKIYYVGAEGGSEGKVPAE